MNAICTECSQFREFTDLAEAKDNQELIKLLKYVHLRVNGPSAVPEIDPTDFERMKAIACVLKARGIDLPKEAEKVNLRLLGSGMLAQYCEYVRGWAARTEGLTHEFSFWFLQLISMEIQRRRAIQATKEMNGV